MSTPLQRYRLSLGIFVVGLLLSGLTAFPLLAELHLLSSLLGITDPSRYAELAGLHRWIAFVLLYGEILACREECSAGFRSFPRITRMNADGGTGLRLNIRVDLRNPREGLGLWLRLCRPMTFGLETSYARFPFLGYGTDWLAFGHVAIAVFFIRPFSRPLESDWVLKCGLICCAGIIPLALIAGPVRGIPLPWRLIDCSFGVLGALPLLYCLRQSRLVRAATHSQSKNVGTQNGNTP